MSRRWGVWLTGAAASVLMVGVSITGNQAYTDHGLRWAWLIGAIAVAGLSVVVGQRLARSQPRGIMRLTGDKGRPPLLDEATLTQLGVHESRFSDRQQSRYVPREKDRHIADALQEGDRRLVIVRGPRLAGTTRTLAEAARTILPDHRIVAFTVDQRLSMAEMVKEAAQWARDWPGAVLWVDPLTNSQFEQIDQALLDALPDGLWVLATLHTEDSTGYRAPAQVMQTLDENAAVVTLGTLTSGERAALRAEEAYRDLVRALDRDSDVLIGRLMVALDQIQNALTPGVDETSSDRVSLLRAITDWWRVDMPGLLTRDVLIVIYEDYRREAAGLGPGTAVSRMGFDRAVAWATTEANPGRPQLVDVQAVTGGVQYVPHPLLDVVAEERGPGWTVSDALWTYAERTVRGDARIGIGYAALDYGAFAHARKLLDPFRPNQVSPNALLAIARWLDTTGDARAARSWYAKVSATADADAAPQAMYRLGRLEADLGNQSAARRWYERVIETTHPDSAPMAMTNLGTLEKQQGNEAEARRRWKQAIGTEHPEAAPRAMVNLGMLALEQQDQHEARRWWEQAIGTDHPEMSAQAMLSLAELAYDQREYEQARQRWEQAAATKHPDKAPWAMLKLAELDSEQGNMVEARRWWGEAIRSKHPVVAPRAMYSLGFLEQELGNLPEARRWYDKAIKTEEPEAASRAMTNLGNPEARLGNDIQARRLFKQAIGTGHIEAAPGAKIGLAGLEGRQGNIPAARRLLDEAIGTGVPGIVAYAKVNLGLLERAHGNSAAARRAWEETVSTGIVHLARDAEQLLADLNRREDENRRAEQFGRYGWQAYADKSLMTSGPSAEDEKQEKDNRP
jgi:tetratricopeptide (TPR) repeat protein